MNVLQPNHQEENSFQLGLNLFHKALQQQRLRLLMQ